MNHSMTFEEQTEQIVEALFTTLCLKKQELQVTERCLKLVSENEIHLEGRCSQGPLRAEFQGSRWRVVDSASSFDPVDIANLLRSIGDQYKAEMEGHVQAIIAEESTTKIKKFGEVAKSLSTSWIIQTPGLEPVRAFLAVAVKLFEQLVEKTHGDRHQINILTETINRNPEVRGYVERPGGWDNLGFLLPR
ncbi:bcl-2-like protein 15 [Protobothrops mucrosquamatus]|uniref:bcl-2-like protein 15 n=1 Tax=Protobothrops mucrosquamatus TaxID=103944 RepID=UPI000775A121|nr:bcl-2-like protein 15 [Protobothrops mucrosquamatus]